jgi:hypothetical protein
MSGGGSRIGRLPRGLSRWQPYGWPLAFPGRTTEGTLMTKSRESGENEITREAKKEAARTKEDVCAILARWLADALKAGDTERVQKIRKAQKYRGCRNIQKRGLKA